MFIKHTGLIACNEFVYFHPTKQIYRFKGLYFFRFVTGRTRAVQLVIASMSLRIINIQQYHNSLNHVYSFLLYDKKMGESWNDVKKKRGHVSILRKSTRLLFNAEVYFPPSPCYSTISKKENKQQFIPRYLSIWARFKPFTNIGLVLPPCHIRSDLSIT